jgi:thiamine biosynthesis lipoprotein
VSAPATRFRHHPLVGTTVEIEIRGLDDAAAREVDALAVGEMERLERIFNAFDPESELSRWKRDALDVASAEFVEVMRSAQEWQLRSGGRFNPLAGVVTARWRAAESDGAVPAPEELSSLAAAIVEPRFRVVDGRVERSGDCDDLNLNAIAKGFIVDRAVDRAVERVAGRGGTVLVNAGGDLAHRGPAAIRIGVENPLRPFDNEPPIAYLVLADGAVATSGGARRGFRIGGRRYSHVIDPRTGRPADRIASITVVADDAMTADVVATVLGVVDPRAAVDEAPSFGAECLVVGADGSLSCSAGWVSAG